MKLRERDNFLLKLCIVFLALWPQTAGCQPTFSEEMSIDPHIWGVKEVDETPEAQLLREGDRVVLAVHGVTEKQKSTAVLLAVELKTRTTRELPLPESISRVESITSNGRDRLCFAGTVIFRGDDQKERVRGHLWCTKDDSQEWAPIDPGRSEDHLFSLVRFAGNDRLFYIEVSLRSGSWTYRPCTVNLIDRRMETCSSIPEDYGSPRTVAQVDTDSLLISTDTGVCFRYELDSNSISQATKPMPGTLWIVGKVADKSFVGLSAFGELLVLSSNFGQTLKYRDESVTYPLRSIVWVSTGYACVRDYREREWWVAAKTDHPEVTPMVTPYTDEFRVLARESGPVAVGLDRRGGILISRVLFR